MNLQSRSELIRSRFRALGGIPFPKSDKIHPQKVQPRRKGYHLEPYPGMLYEQNVKWVGKPDERTFETLPEHHRQGKPALIQIAKKTPRKLLRDEGKLKRYKL